MFDIVEIEMINPIKDIVPHYFGVDKDWLVEEVIFNDDTPPKRGSKKREKAVADFVKSLTSDGQKILYILAMREGKIIEDYIPF